MKGFQLLLAAGALLAWLLLHGAAVVGAAGGPRLDAASVSAPLGNTSWERPAEDSWVPLFDGKDLSGWRKNGEERWEAEDGTIVGESTVGHYGYLTTEKTYRDFDLRLRFRPEAAGNSGVFFHSRITGTDPTHGPDIEGMQVEVDPNPGKHTGGLYESGGRGWVAQPTVEGEQALNLSSVHCHYNH